MDQHLQLGTSSMHMCHWKCCKKWWKEIKWTTSKLRTMLSLDKTPTCGRGRHTKNCFAQGGGKEGQWPARNLNEVKCFRCNKKWHFVARDCKEPAPSTQGQVSQLQQVNTTQKDEGKFDFFIGSTADKGKVSKQDDKEAKEESDECVNYAGSKMKKWKIFLIDSGATFHVTYKDHLHNRSPSKSMVYMGDETKAEI